MSVTKRDLERHNEELRVTVQKLERMNDEAMQLARRARHDTDDAQADVIFYRQQRDRLIGFLQGYRKDIGESIEVDPVDRLAISPQISRVDAFLGQCQEEPAVHDTVGTTFR